MAGDRYEEDGVEDTVDTLRTAPGPGDDEEGDTTVVRPARATAKRKPHRTPTAEAAPADDETIVVGSDPVPAGADAAEPSVVHDDPVADTVSSLDTSTTHPMDTSSSDPAGDSTVDPVDAAEAGVVGTAAAGADDDTIVIEGAADAGADTIAVPRGGGAVEAIVRPDDDPTAIVGPAAPRGGRTRPADPTGAGGTGPAGSMSAGSVPVKPVMVAPAKRRRRALRPAPVPPGYGERAVLAPGAGAVSTYRVREIPRPPASAQALANRSVDRVTAGIASVSKRSRRLSMLAIGGFGLSLVVSVTGLVLIARSAILGY